MNRYLRKISSIQFEFRELANCIIQLVEGYDFTEVQIEKSLSLSNGNIKSTENNINRFFIYRDYLDKHFPGENVDDRDLLDIAKTYCSELEQKLTRRFPGKSFEVEIIGEDLVDEEPFELCVTFSST